MTDIDQAIKYLRFALSKALKTRRRYNPHQLDSSSRRIMVKDLINYTEQALEVSRRL